MFGDQNTDQINTTTALERVTLEGKNIAPLIQTGFYSRWKWRETGEDGGFEDFSNKCPNYDLET